MKCEILQGDCLTQLKTLPDKSIQTCVTSPPYYALRDYGTGKWIGGDENCNHRVGNVNTDTIKKQGNGKWSGHHTGVGPGCDAYKCKLCGAIREDDQIGIERTPEEYIENLVKVFREVRRVLKDDGTIWVNIGDSYNSQPAGNKSPSGFSQTRPSRQKNGIGAETIDVPKKETGLKPKDLIGIPWMLAFALRNDGWYLRQDIIWSKKNCMPESVTDRCTKSHEYIFLLSKNKNYYYDNEAVKEDGVIPAGTKTAKGSTERVSQKGVNSRPPDYKVYDGKRNKRSVWHVGTKSFKEAHFAVFPEELIEPCILAGSKKGDIVMDVFTGSGTTALVSLKNGRSFIGTELNPDYVKIANKRIKDNKIYLNESGEVIDFESMLFQ